MKLKDVATGVHEDLIPIIRGAWMTTPISRIRKTAVDRAAMGKWLEAAVLMELALDLAEEQMGVK